MRITLLLILMLLVTAAWVVTGVVREHSIVRNAHVHQALQLYSQQELLQNIHQQHQETIQRLTGREEPAQGQIESPELPEWVTEYIVVQEDNGFSSYSVKSNVGSYLSSVPVLWFHGSFAALHLMLIVLGLASIYYPASGA